MQMDERKRKRRCEHDCKDHIFSLQTTKSTYSKYDIKVQFCPKYQREPLPPEQTFPEFNQDKKYYTSAFVLGIDKRMLLKNQQQQIMDHQKQIRDSLEKHNQLVFPRPNSKHTLCSVCKEHFKNYYGHIISEEHRDRIGLSSYNAHIKDLCYLYVDLWDGCEDKADQQAQRLAALEEERRQRMAQSVEEDDSNSLADCMRGSAEEQRFDEEGNPIPLKSKKIKKVHSRMEQSIPLMGRKKSSQHAYQPIIRKQIYSHATSIHGIRDRKERNYERERLKAVRGTEFQKYKRDYMPVQGYSDDIFTIMRPCQQNEKTPEFPSKKIERTHKKIFQQTPKKSEQDQIMIQEEEKSIQNRIFPHSSEQVQQIKPEEIEIKQVKSVQEGELSHSDSDSDNGFFSRRTQRKKRVSPEYRIRALEDKNEGKHEPRNYQGYHYPYQPPMHPPPYGPPPSGQPGQNYKVDQERFKNMGGNEAQRFKGHPEGYNGQNYYYPPPYNYPPMDYPYHDAPPSGDKEKGKDHQKPYDYPPMNYPWYPPSPYYMPPSVQAVPSSQQNSDNARTEGVQVVPPPPSQGSRPQSSGKNSSDPYSGSTNININFPMCLWAPGPYMPPPSRYPGHPPMMNHYSGYPYGPYRNQRQEKREGEFQPRGYPRNPPPPPYQHGGSQSHLEPPQPPSHNIPPPPSSQGYLPHPKSSAQGGSQSQGSSRGGSHNPYPYYPPPYMQYHPGYHSNSKSPKKKEP